MRERERKNEREREKRERESGGWERRGDVNIFIPHQAKTAGGNWKINERNARIEIKYN